MEGVLVGVQLAIYEINAHLASCGAVPFVGAHERVAKMEEIINILDEQLPPLQGFIGMHTSPQNEVGLRLH
jgi:cob(I)alamin adenosyltransferase